MIKRIGSRSVNGFGIGFYPFSDTQQYIALEFHHRTIAPRANVEQEVSAAGNNFHQAGNFLIHFFLHTSTFLPRTIAPRFVENRCGGLPRNTQFVIGIFVIGHHGKIYVIIPQSAADHTLRLQFINQVIKQLTLFRFQRTHIEPNFGNGAVIDHNFFHLFQVESIMLRCNWICIVARDGIRFRKIPVYKRIIDRKFNSSTGTSIGQFLHQIAAVWRSIHNIEISVLGMIHTKSVVVLGCENNGFHPRIFCQLHNLIGIPLGRIKFPRRIGVPIAENSGKRLNLFAISSLNRLSVIHSTINGIQTEMNEHRKFLIEPLLRRFLLSICKKSNA